MFELLKLLSVSPLITNSIDRAFHVFVTFCLYFSVSSLYLCNWCF